MLPKKNRLDKKAIQKVFEGKVFLNSPNLSFRYIFVEKNQDFKISFLTPKSIDKRSTKRNSLRRKGYLVLFNNKNLIPKGLQGVFIFGKKSKIVFLGKKTKIFNPSVNLDNEIKLILNKL